MHILEMIRGARGINFHFIEQQEITLAKPDIPSLTSCGTHIVTIITLLQFQDSSWFRCSLLPGSYNLKALKNWILC